MLGLTAGCPALWLASLKNNKLHLGGVELNLQAAYATVLELMVSFCLLQNALPSDEDDKDPNDPYKALDIDLDK